MSVTQDGVAKKVWKQLQWVLIFAIPIVELATLLWLANRIGDAMTVLLVIASTALGLLVVWAESRGSESMAAAVKEYQAEHGGDARIPAEVVVPHMIRTFIMFFAAVLLFIPGFVTDAVAIVMLILLRFGRVGGWMEPGARKAHERGEDAKQKRRDAGETVTGFG